MITLISSLVVLILLVQWYYHQTFGYWKRKGVPGPTPLPIVGNLGQVLITKEHVGDIYMNMYNNFKDYLYVGFYKIQSPGLLIRDVELIKTILVKDFSSFHDNDVTVDTKDDPLFSKDPFVLTGDRWKIVRSKITATMTSAKIKQMIPYMNKIAKTLVEYLNNTPDASNDIGLEAKDLATSFSADIIGACAFGLNTKSFEDPNAEFKKMGKEIFVESLSAVWVFLFPSLAKMFKMSLIPEKVRKWFIATIEETIKYREENNIVMNDYLDSMIALKSNPNHDYVCTDMDIMAHLIVFFADGMETSSVALSFVLYALAKNPDVQERLQEEVDAVLAKYDGEIVYEAIQEMKYMDMVISESLRMYSPAPMLLKLCTKQFALPPPRGEGTGPKIVVEAGTSIIIPIKGIHYDPQFYPDPHKFDPLRFTEEAKNSRPKCSYIPFGEGPRICLGSRFGVTLVKAALLATVRNFDIKINPKTTPNMELETLSLFTTKKGGLWLNFHKRDK